MRNALKSLLVTGLMGVIACGVNGAEAVAPVNMLQNGNDFSAKEWKPFCRNTVVAPEKVAGPDSTLPGFHLQIKSGFIGQVLKTAITGHTYQFTVWMKSATGADQKVMLAGENNPPAATSSFVPFKLTGEWQKCSMTFECPAGGNSQFRFSIRNGDIYVAGAEVVDVTVAK